MGICSVFGRVGRLGSSVLVRRLVYEKENSEFKLRLKIDPVSYPTLAEGLVNMVFGRVEDFHFEDVSNLPSAVPSVFSLPFLGAALIVVTFSI